MGQTRFAALASAIAAGFLAASCSPSAPPTTPALEAPPALPAPPADITAPLPDPLASPSAPGHLSPPIPFAIAVTFTPRARDEVAAAGERVVVNAMYESGGELAQTALLGEELREIEPRDQTVAFEGRFPAARLPEGATPKVLVNVYTTRTTRDRNLLDCGIYQDAVAKAAASGAAPIHCKLIGE